MVAIITATAVNVIGSSAFTPNNSVDINPALCKNRKGLGTRGYYSYRSATMGSTRVARLAGR
jgi:hypothetical protein